jgi:hypothetical protein
MERSVIFLFRFLINRIKTEYTTNISIVSPSGKSMITFFFSRSILTRNGQSWVISISPLVLQKLGSGVIYRTGFLQHSQDVCLQLQNQLLRENRICYRKFIFMGR